MPRGEKSSDTDRGEATAGRIARATLNTRNGGGNKKSGSP